jgi:nitric oxide reductase NorD protein
MPEPIATPALVVERSCGVVTVALSRGRRQGARLVSGERRGFGMNPGRTVV